MIRVALLGTLLLAGCATAPATPADSDPQACHVTVSFGSYAMGVDAELKTDILAVINADPGVMNVEETRWGREGEFDLCIHAPGRGIADRLYNQIADLIPEYSDRAPTTVTHIDGRTDASGPPPGWN